MKNSFPDVNQPDMEKMDMDQLLKEMAEETPEMPADFHARWTQAVRQEAEQAGRESRQQPDHAAEKRRDRRTQWKRLAGVAAIFVFLIGGTLLSRDALRPAVQVESPEAAPLMSNSVPFAANERKSTVADAAMPLGTSAPTNMPEPALAAGMADGGEAPMEASPEAMLSEEAAVAEETEEMLLTDMDEAMDSFAEEPAEAFEEEVEEEEPEAEEEAEEAEETESVLQRFGKEAVLFLEDMGRFVLAALPYLAGAAVLVTGILVIKRKK